MKLASCAFGFLTFVTALSSSLAAIVNDKLSVHEVKDWPSAPIPKLGLVSGVAVNSREQPIIFHRGPRKIKPYDSKLYNKTGHFLLSHEGPIMEDTVLTLDARSGAVVSSWGKGLFYFPHGIAIDQQDNVWLTDIALHQVLKFAENSTTPELTLGQKFSPGSGLDQFCKPTAVVISKDGNIFVADGYCNNRVLKFDPKGQFLQEFPTEDTAPSGFSLNTPHSLAFIDESDLLCIADRENKRVVCISMNPKVLPPSLKFKLLIQQPKLGSVWAIAGRGNLLFAVNGSLPHTQTSGFILDPVTEEVVDVWNPESDKFGLAHDMAVSPDGNSLYVAEVGPSKIWKFEIKKIG